MNPKVYKQADSRWGSLPYPTKAYKFASNGCGCCSVTHCIIEIPAYANLTPKDVQKYMVQFATKGHGTLWKGITQGLEHETYKSTLEKFGYNVHWNEKDSMSTIWKVLKTSLKRGVILFGSSKGGTAKITWTTGGHYIAFLDWKYENGDYWFYLKDSGGRNHTGWYSYKKHMAGDVRNVWICTSLKSTPTPPKPTPKPTPSRKGTYTGVIPTPTLKSGSKGTGVTNLQKFLNWYGKYGLTVDGKFGTKTATALKKFQKSEGIKADGIYGKNSFAKAKAYKKVNPR